MSRNRFAAAFLAGATLLVGTAARAAAPATSPAAADDGTLHKYFVAYDRDVTVADLEVLTALGAVRAIEFRTIDTVAITAPLPAVVAAASLPELLRSDGAP